MLGVTDHNTPEVVAAAESSIAGFQPVVPLAACSSGTKSEDSSSDDDDNDNDKNGDQDNNKAISLVKHKRSKSAHGDSSRGSEKRPKIVELS